MDKRKTVSKGRLIKAKVDLTKLITPHTDSASRLIKINLDPGKKTVTPTQSRISKSKSILNKRTSETPKPKIEDFDQKRKSSPNTQENLEAYYSSYIKALASKLDKHKLQNQETEEELKQMEQNFQLEETSLKNDIEKLMAENKKLKKEKFQQEAELMEENFKVRKEFEEFKLMISGTVNEITTILQGVNLNTWENVKHDIIKALGELSNVEDKEGVRASLKGTASFSNVAHDVYSPKAVNRTTYKEAIVMFPFEAEASDQICLSVGDRVLVLKNDDGAWWVGKVADKVGKFPKKCVMLD